MILELIGIIYWKMVEKNYGLMTIDRVKKTRDSCKINVFHLKKVQAIQQMYEFDAYNSWI